MKQNNSPELWNLWFKRIFHTNVPTNNKIGCLPNTVDRIRLGGGFSNKNRAFFHRPTVFRRPCVLERSPVAKSSVFLGNMKLWNTVGCLSKIRLGAFLNTVGLRFEYGWGVFFWCFCPAGRSPTVFSNSIPETAPIKKHFSTNQHRGGPAGWCRGGSRYVEGC